MQLLSMINSQYRLSDFGCEAGIEVPVRVAVYKGCVYVADWYKRQGVRSQQEKHILLQTFLPGFFFAICQVVKLHPLKKSFTPEILDKFRVFHFFLQ